MKTYEQYLNESVSVYNTVKSFSHDDLDKCVNDTTPLTYHHVRGMLDNKHINDIDGVNRLVHRSKDIDSKGLGLLAMHAMSHKDPYIRQQHAYHLVGSGKLSDTQLKHIATHSLKNSHNGMFDDHLSNRIKASSINKDEISKHIETIKGS